jgi:hypothetical protein
MHPPQPAAARTAHGRHHREGAISFARCKIQEKNEQEYGKSGKIIEHHLCSIHDSPLVADIVKILSKFIYNNSRH